MAAEIQRLKTKPQRAAADRLEQLALALADEATHGKGEVAKDARALLAKVRRANAAEERWLFVMINAAQFEAIYDWLEAHSPRPQVATRLWVKLIQRLDRATGEIVASRAELATAAGTTPHEVSRIMGQLVEVGAVIRQRVPANGPVCWYLNPRVGTHLPAPVRQAAQDQAPHLRLIEAGDLVSERG